MRGSVSTMMSKSTSFSEKEDMSLLGNYVVVISSFDQAIDWRRRDSRKAEAVLSDGHCGEDVVALPVALAHEQDSVGGVGDDPVDVEGSAGLDLFGWTRCRWDGME